jgi:membrane associated rhomboid family serine protease
MMTAQATHDAAPDFVPLTVAVRATHERARLDGWLLALEARGIPGSLEWRGADGAVVLHVPTLHADVARCELDAVDAEELERRLGAEAEVAAANDNAHADRGFAPLGGVLVGLLLLAFFVVTGPVAGRAIWFSAGDSDAVRVLHGEWWRTITALTLHADENHVLSNVALGGVVVALVMRRTGVGFGAALVLLAGALGNLINAWGYGVGHRSIGFSTAVFAAIGILGGLAYVASLPPRGQPARRKRPAWTAIAGALALLAMLGASERTDMLAHLFGTLAGLAVGVTVGLSRWVPRTPGQIVFGAATIATVVGAWSLALA